MVFLVTGPDTFRAREKLRELRAKFLKEVDPTGLSMATVDGKTVRAAELPHYMATGGLFARRRFVVFEELLQNKNADVANAAGALLEQEQATTGNVVVLYESAEPPAKHALTSWLKANAYVQAYPMLSGSALQQWVVARLQTQERTIAPKAAAQLVATSEGDLWRLNGMLQQLMAMTTAGTTIDEVTVQALLTTRIDDEIFPLIDALVSGDVRRALPLLHEQLGAGAAPQVIVSLLEQQLRVLLVLVDQPQAHVVGVHPFVIRKLQPLARRFARARVGELYAALAALDIELKSSTLDPKTILTAFALRVA